MSLPQISALLLAGVPVGADLPPEPLPVESPIPAEETGGPAIPLDIGEQSVPDTVIVEAGADGADDEYHEIVVSGSTEAPPGDPLVKFNAQSYEMTQAVDDALVAPLAKGYEDVVPKPVRSGLRNFFRNLKAPIIALNFLLQLKPGKAAETLGRFAINSTVGIGGLIDVAKNEPFNLPYRNNGFANTLGYYGVKPGPFFFLPLVGPTTLRDVLGGAVDGMVLPTAVGAPFDRMEYTIPTGVVRALDYRLQFDEDLQRIRSTEDPYTAAREYYLEMRQAEIDGLRGIRVDSSAFTAPVEGTAEPQPAPEQADVQADAPTEVPAEVPAAPAEPELQF